MKNISLFLYEWKHFTRSPFKIIALILFVLASVYGLHNGAALYQKQQAEVKKRFRPLAEYLAANYYTVKLNGEGTELVDLLGKEQTPKALIKELRIQGYPTIMVLDDQLELKKINEGYKTAPQLMRFLKRYTD